MSLIERAPADDDGSGRTPLLGPLLGCALLLLLALLIGVPALWRLLAVGPG